MNSLSIYTLKVLRKIYAKCMGIKPLPKPNCEQDPDAASLLIYNELRGERPCMIARFGAFELGVLSNYIQIRNGEKSYLKYILGITDQWWWNKSLINLLYTNAGFFPPTQEKIEQFCELMLEDMKELDVLGSWLANESYFSNELKFISKVDLLCLDPYWGEQPWTLALEGKKVLVIHPFTEDIISQYQKRCMLFSRSILPEFELLTIKAVQSISGTKTKFNDWFEALGWMKDQMDRIDYDICLIGAGAYGFPLAAHAKRKGKKVVHLGGSLQLLFGIKGKRWENWSSTSRAGKCIDYKSLMNRYWVRPNAIEIPLGHERVDNSSYW